MAIFARFSHPRTFNAPVEGVPLGMYGSENQNDATRMSKGVADMSIRFDTVPALDGRTDRQNLLNTIALCMHRHADAQ